VQYDDIPTVCLIEDILRIFRISRRTFDRMRRAGTFPIRELRIGGRPRWSGADVPRFLEGSNRGSRILSRGRWGSLGEHPDMKTGREEAPGSGLVNQRTQLSA
jgi:hypothetical protein